jgi:precorrin-8X/cobalt-precorrin-8 methylmutase
MDLDFTDASSLAIIDRQIAETTEIAEKIPPAQYEIIRQVIYSTADLEYQSLLKFSPAALAKGAAAIMAITPIIVDVPEIQVSIVPRLQKTFGNPVYCCATTNSNTDDKNNNFPTKAARGLEILAHKYPQSIFIIGQDQSALFTMIDLFKNKAIKPSLAIATSPMFIESAVKQKLAGSGLPHIYIDSPKGGANIASAIFNSLIQLTWQTELR